MLLLKFGSLPYAAVILFEPAGNFDVVKLATPLLSVLVPRTVVPFRKVTVPVGVPPEDETVAAKVTLLPNTEGFTEETNCVVVASGAILILATKASNCPL